MLPDHLHVTTEMGAEYYEVDKMVIRLVVHRHRDELKSDGMKVLRGDELQRFKKELQNVTLKARSKLTILPRRAVLRIGMLLRDSEVAKKVHSYLLNVEQFGTPSGSDSVSNFR